MTPASHPPPALGSQAGLPATPWRRRAWWLLWVLVLGLHLWLGDRISASMISLADATRPAMQRMQVSYTRVLAPTEPVPVIARPRAPAVHGPRAARAAGPVATPASAVPLASDEARPELPVDSDPNELEAGLSLAQAASGNAASGAPASSPGGSPGSGSSSAAAGAMGSAAEQAADGASAPSDASSGPVLAARASAPVGDASALPAAEPSTLPPAVKPTVQSAGVAAARAASGAPAATGAAAASAVASAANEQLDGVTWPTSTRLRYELHGWYRGEVGGSAQVEWLRDGRRYQVHLEVSLGPTFAPLARRRMSSEGRIGADGLVPQRYEQETWQIIGRTRRADMVLGSEFVILANGQRQVRPADVQDTASQFVQMVFLLMTRPELAQAGASVEFALALPHRIDRWTYETVGAETITTPAGAIATVHIKPRRRATNGDLTAQMWLAPALQMLPARIRIEQDDATWADLLLAQLPEQAAR